MTIYAWVAWAGAAALVVLCFVIADVSRLRLALICVAAVIVVAVILFRRAAFRVRWVLTLRQDHLIVERHSGVAVERLPVNVRNGVRLAVDFADPAASIDACVVLTAEDWRITMTVGERPRLALAEIADFLRQNDVRVIDKHTTRGRVGAVVPDSRCVSDRPTRSASRR